MFFKNLMGLKQNWPDGFFAPNLAQSSSARFLGHRDPLSPHSFPRAASLCSAFYIYHIWDWTWGSGQMLLSKEETWGCRVWQRRTAMYWEGFLNGAKGHLFTLQFWFLKPSGKGKWTRTTILKLSFMFCPRFDDCLDLWEGTRASLRFSHHLTFLSSSKMPATERKPGLLLWVGPGLFALSESRGHLGENIQ